MVKRHRDAASVVTFILKLTELTVNSVTALTETEKGRTDKQKQFVDNVLKTRHTGFAPSVQHPHERITVGYAIVGELFSR
jgi:hypothetical protein